MHEFFEKWGKWANESQVKPEMMEGKGDDEESKAQMLLDGIKDNRFLSVTLVDIALA